MPTNLDNEFMQKVTVLVKENLGKDLTVDTLCAGMNMSRTSFYNKIKALTGMAPNDFIRIYVCKRQLLFSKASGIL